MIFIAAFLTAIADMTWGGQFDRWLPSGTRRFLALSLVTGTFWILFSWQIAAVIFLGYFLRRMIGWRTLWSNEPFLSMSKPSHGFYMFLHSLPLIVTPIVGFLFTSISLWYIIPFIIASALIACSYYVIINVGHSRKLDWVHFAEASAGVIMGITFFYYGTII